MSNQTFLSVWDAIEDTPEQAENMKLRSVLTMAIKDPIVRTEMSQAQAAKRFDVAQPRVSDLMRGKMNLFALDALVNMAAAANMRIEMRVLEAPAKRSAGTPRAFKTAAGKKQTATAKKPAAADKPATKAPRGAVTVESRRPFMRASQKAHCAHTSCRTPALFDGAIPHIGVASAHDTTGSGSGVHQRFAASADRGLALPERVERPRAAKWRE